MNTTITPEEFATEQQIARNHERLARIGDRDRTGNLLADWEAEQMRERIAEMERRTEAHARGNDLPLFA